MKTGLVIAALFVTAVLSLNAVDEGSLAARYADTIVPYVAANSQPGQMRTPDGAVLHWLKTTNGDPRRIMVLLGGHTESCVKYDEMLYDLRDTRLTIYALDQRGQGLSSRMLPDREKDHVDTYERYQSDLEQFMREVVSPGPGSRVILLGHSLGGAVAALFAERHPQQLSGLILSSPYLGSKAGGLALFLVRTLDFFGAGTSYVPGGGPFDFVPFEKNAETHSRVRHERKMQDYRDQPDTRLGYPTNHWLWEMEKQAAEIRRNAAGLAVPVLVLQAGDDKIADTTLQDRFALDAHAEKVLLPGAYHEILIETDQIRNAALDKIRSFIAANCP